MPAPRRTPLPRRGTASLLVLAAVVVVALGTLLDTASAGSHDGLARLRFGLPLPWVSQDQGVLDPPAYPWEVRLGDPSELVTRLHPWPLLGDLLLVLGILLLGWYAAQVHRSRRAVAVEPPGQRPR